MRVLNGSTTLGSRSWLQFVPLVMGFESARKLG